MLFLSVQDSRILENLHMLIFTLNKLYRQIKRLRELWTTLDFLLTRVYIMYEFNKAYLSLIWSAHATNVQVHILRHNLKTLQEKRQRKDKYKLNCDHESLKFTFNVKECRETWEVLFSHTRSSSAKNFTQKFCFKTVLRKNLHTKLQSNIKTSFDYTVIFLEGSPMSKFRWPNVEENRLRALLLRQKKSSKTTHNATQTAESIGEKLQIRP